MPYTLEQLKFLGLHLGVVIPPEPLEKKSKSEGASGEKESSEKEAQEKEAAEKEARDKEVRERRRALLDEASKLKEPEFADANGLKGLSGEREAAMGALADEMPTAEQFAAAEKAIKAFGENVEAERARANKQAKELEATLATLTDPAGANAEEKEAMQAERDKIENAIQEEAPTLAQFKTAEESIATLKGLIKQVEDEVKLVSEKRQALLDEVAALQEPECADENGLKGLNDERQAAAGALAPERPTLAQLEVAEKAIKAFNDKMEAEWLRANKQAKEMEATLAALTDPEGANEDEKEAMKKEREKAEEAIQEEAPTPAQFKTAEEAIAALEGLIKQVEDEMKTVLEKRKDLLDQVADLKDPEFADADGLKELKKQREAAAGALTPERPTQAEFETAEKAIEAFEEKVESERKRANDLAKEMESTLATLTDPAGADAEEKEAMKKQREKAEEAIQEEAPTPAQFKTAEKAMAALRGLIKQSKKMGAFATTNPGAAAEARKAFKDCRDAMLDEDVTPEMVADVERRFGEARAAFDAIEQRYQVLQTVPEGETEQQRLAREQALEELNPAGNAAADAVNDLADRFDALEAHRKAALREKFLTEATERGPLSGETGRTFSDDTAQKLVKAFAKDPKLAGAAVKTATIARHPDAIADSLDLIADQVAAGFESTGTGALKWTSEDHSRGYAEKLLNMGGELGGEFFAGLPAYIQSGNQFKPDPVGDSPPTFGALAQKRSVVLAKSLLKPDGTIDVTSGGAKEMVASLLYHPDTLKNPTPAMNAAVLKTVKFLGDPVTGPQASEVLKATAKPTAPGAQKLVRSAMAKGDTEAVSDGDTRAAVLAAMLKPIQQGPVGSCFSTAPTRLLRETKPLEVMKAYSDIASKGVYKPASGVGVPVVTKLPADEDPLHRSLEYTLATSASRVADSLESQSFNNKMAAGIEQFGAISGGNQSKWVANKAKLKRDVKAAFNFVYDPMSIVTDSSDGSSTQGRYVLRRISTKQEITTKERFIEEMADVAMKSLNIDPRSPKAQEVKDLVKGSAFIDAVCPGKYKPWAQATGGHAIAMSKALFSSSTMRKQDLIPKSPTSPKPPVGERTTAVLKSFLDGFSGRTDEMVTVDTVGRHSFNALPNHPSLAGLKGNNPGETAAKIQTNLVDKGQALKNTDLSVERSAWLFDQEMKKAIDRESNPTFKGELEKGAKAKRPAATMKPADVTRAIKEASESYHLLVAEKQANEWKQKEVDAGRTVADDKLAEKKSSLKGIFDSNAENEAKSLMVRDLGAPEFVIADTNWGDSRSHQMFVISPDPTTGEPMMWKKVEPPGSLTPMGREWVDDQWIHIT